MEFQIISKYLYLKDLWVKKIHKNMLNILYDGSPSYITFNNLISSFEREKIEYNEKTRKPFC